MVPAPLVQHFDLIAQAPGGVARLREFILTLAVQGKLVPQDPSDEPASELLKKIKTEKDRLIAEGKIKRDKSLAEILESDSTANIPNSWTLARLGTVVNVSTGKLDANAAVPGGRYPFFTCSATPLEIDSYSFDCKAVLLAGNGDFNLKRYEGKFDAYQRTYVIEPILWDLQYLYFLLSQNISIITKNNRGSAIPYLKLGDITEPVIAIPPLAEQSRIVNRVEELMQLCDALEASGQLEAQQHAQLVNTLLGTLTQNETPEALADNWQRIATHFDVMLDRPEAVDALEQTILQLAVRGLLVPQDPTDEPASVLLQKIRTEKDHLIAQGKIKRDKPLPSIADEEKPFGLPYGWEWVRMQQVFDVRDGTHDTPKYVQEDGVPLITSRNFRDGRICFEDAKLISKVDHEQIMRRSRVERYDILYSMIGGNIGNQVMVDTDKEFSIKNVALFKFVSREYTSPQFLDLFLATVTLNLQGQAVGGAQPFVSLSLLRSIPFPLLPFAEQLRIVSRVNELRVLLTELRQRLVDCQLAESQLADVLVAFS
jgi:type I restriction enzyme S subunit